MLTPTDYKCTSRFEKKKQENVGTVHIYLQKQAEFLNQFLIKHFF